MSQETTIRKLAEQHNVSAEKLLKQLADDGMQFSGPDHVVTGTEKIKVQGLLRRTQKGNTATSSEPTTTTPKKIVLNRRKQDELVVNAGAGRNKTTVNVEVRQRKTYVKNTDAAPNTNKSNVSKQQQNVSKQQKQDEERAEILRKLEESRQRNLEEQQRLAEQDRLRAEALKSKTSLLAEETKPAKSIKPASKVKVASVRAEQPSATAASETVVAEKAEKATAQAPVSTAAKADSETSKSSESTKVDAVVKTETTEVKPTVDVKTETKAEVKTEEKAEARTEAKTEVKAEAKSDVKREPRNESRPRTDNRDNRSNTSRGSSTGSSAGNRDGQSNRGTGTGERTGQRRTDGARPAGSNSGEARTGNNPNRNQSGGARTGGVNTGTGTSASRSGAPRSNTDRRPSDGRTGSTTGEARTGNNPRTGGQQRSSTGAGTGAPRPPRADGAPRPASTGAGAGASKSTPTGKPLARTASPSNTKTRPDAGRAENRTSNRPKTRGSHAMVSTIEDDDRISRFAGQINIDGGERRRGGRNKNKTRRQVSEPSRTATGAHGFERPTAPVIREVAIGETITVADLAQKLALKGGEVVKTLFKMGVMATITQTIDHDTAALVTEELGHKPVRAEFADAESDLLAHTDQDQGEKAPRPPVVTIMGHVDHGKTSLLDYLRRTKVATGEAGGITQHIGAYHVETPRGVVSFLDTPGHAAFAQMRARGAKLTDIVVLVVAADDGVMPQTIEAIQHARSANVPLIVAVNKIDKPAADPLKVKNELLAHNVVSEEFGGDIQCVELSAKTGAGIDDLLEAILIQSEILELRAVPEGRATGVVIESSLDKGRGPVATVLVQQGALRKGDYLVCGIQYGRVRALFDETGKQPESAGPSIPVQILGLSGVPDAGDDFVVVADERLAKDVAQQRETKRRESRLVKQGGNRMEDIMAQMSQGGDQQVLNLVIKADVQGSVEALKQSLTSLSNDQIRINVISSGVGGINESDANVGLTAKATIIGFNVRADASARRIIEANKVDLRYFSIIYDVIDQVKQVASGLLGVEIREEIIGIAQVRDVFRSSKFGAVAGCMVLEGVVKRNKPIRVLRDSTVVFEGELESLRRFKDNVDEVRNGTECGIAVKQYNDVKPGDQIECFERIEVQRTL